MSLSASLRAAAAFAVTAIAVFAQDPSTPDPRAVYPERLCVKLAEGSGAWLVDGVLQSRTGVDLAPVAALFARATCAPMVTAVSWEVLDEWHTKACAVQPPHNRPGHLGLWFRLTAPSVDAAVQLRAALSAEPLVAHVYHEPRLYLASMPAPGGGGDVPPTTPLFLQQQQSLEAGPTGHGVRFANCVLGARGQGVRFVMLEDSFLLDHEDVCQLTPSHFLSPVPPPGGLHGVAGASVVCATRNGYGFNGIADEVDARFTGISNVGGTENAIALAVANTQPGDVLLLVAMVIPPFLGPGAFVPFEFYQGPFDATLTASSLGRHMVVPAGNGFLSLDDPLLLNRFDRNFRDSGAVIVGASQPGPLGRAPYSNWGSRIDANGWGDNVGACGYPGLFFPNNDLQQAYTASYTGTSSASAHLAGIVAALQGAAKRQLGQMLTNAQLLNLLHTVGPLGPDVIGRRPDLRLLLETLGAIDGLTIDQPDFDLNETMTVTMSGPSGALVALFAAFATADIDLGFNRHVHLDPLGAVAVGAYLLTTGSDTYALQVPNAAALHGSSVYFQALRLVGTNPFHLTNSCQATVR